MKRHTVPRELNREPVKENPVVFQIQCKGVSENRLFTGNKTTTQNLSATFSSIYTDPKKVKISGLSTFLHNDNPLHVFSMWAPRIEIHLGHFLEHPFKVGQVYRVTIEEEKG